MSPKRVRTSVSPPVMDAVRGLAAQVRLYLPRNSFTSGVILFKVDGLKNMASLSFSMVISSWVDDLQDHLMNPLVPVLLAVFLLSEQGLSAALSPSKT